MRYPLIVGQGSLGTQEDNNIVASSRYTEAKPSIYADLMMKNYKKNVVPTKETYNNEFYEPVVLPSLFPNALCNGRQTIGLSMSHSSLPHNLGEVCDAIAAYIDNNDISIDEIMTYIKGPDFPLENVVINKDDIKTALATGKSSVSLKVRGVYTIEKNKIIFSTIPYRTYRNKIKEQINKNIDTLEKFIDDFDDESNLGQNKLVFTVKRGVEPEDAVKVLFQTTDLQSTVSYNMNFIIDGTPKLCSIKTLIKAYVDHQNNIVIKIAEYDLDKAEKRKHILEGLLIIINSIDEAINIIRASDNKAIAASQLKKRYNLTDIQADAVLEMKLSRLTKLDNNELIKELEEKKAIIAECNEILNNISARMNKIKKAVQEMKNQYGDKRRTTLLQLEEEKIEKKKKEVIIEPLSLAINAETGLIKKGSVIKTDTSDFVIGFSSLGKMYQFPLSKVSVTAAGSKIQNYLAMNKVEDILYTTTMREKNQHKYIIFVTKKGLVKKVDTVVYEPIKRGNSTIALKLDDDDCVVKILSIDKDNEDIVLMTQTGHLLRFSLDEVKSSTRTSKGIKGISLSENDYVVSAKINVGNALPRRNRGGKGSKCNMISVD